MICNLCVKITLPKNRIKNNKLRREHEQHIISINLNVSIFVSDPYQVWPLKIIDVHLDIGSRHQKKLWFYIFFIRHK